MPQNRTALRIFALGLLSLGLASSMYASKDLKEDSPFLPPGYLSKEASPPPPPPQQNGPIAKQLEFKGLINFSGTYRFSIFNKQNQRSYWLTQGQNQDGIGISSFNVDTQTVVVTMNGRSEQLSLMSASDAPLPVKTSMPTQPSKATASKQPNILPPGLPTNNNNSRSKVPPRRRVILPKKK